MDEPPLLEPKTIIIAILWIEVGIGVFSVWLRPNYVESKNITMLVTLLVLVLTIFYHCPSDVLPIYVEPRLPCVVCRYVDQYPKLCLGLVSQEDEKHIHDTVSETACRGHKTQVTGPGPGA